MTAATRISSRRRVAAALTAGLAAVALSGCAASGPDPAEADAAGIAAGKTLFVGACGSCHVLQDAGTEGRLGPDLDDAFRAARLQGWKESQFEGVVRKWIEIARPPMPRNIVVGEDAENISAYIASVAGTSPESVVRRYEQEEPAIPERDANAPAIDGSPQEAAAE